MSATALASAPSAPCRPLLPLIAAGDDRALGQFVRRFTPFVCSVARRMGATTGTDDLVQETMVRLWRSAGRFDPERGSEPTFVATVTRNVVIDRARREAARPSVPTADVHELAAPIEAAAESVPTRMAVRDALAGLAPAQRELVRMAYFEQLTQKEIAGRLGLPLGTVKSRTFHALKELRRLLQEVPAAA
jgi:RNA polymerase sigma-70 factor, ECF subfamily